MAWIYLLIAGLLEVVWAFYMKQSAGFTRLWPSVITIAARIVSFALLSLSMRTLPLGTAYAIWTGLGAVGVIIGGIVLFGEKVSVVQLAFMALIVIGVAGTKLFAPA